MCALITERAWRLRAVLTYTADGKGIVIYRKSMAFTRGIDIYGGRKGYRYLWKEHGVYGKRGVNGNKAPADL
jgi:hypothetical protein